MGSPVMGCRHLYVFDLSWAVAIVVFDSDVGKFNVPVDARKLVFARAHRSTSSALRSGRPVAFGRPRFDAWRNR
jgi:hypothetical protein